MKHPINVQGVIDTQGIYEEIGYGKDDPEIPVELSVGEFRFLERLTKLLPEPFKSIDAVVRLCLALGMEVISKEDGETHEA